MSLRGESRVLMPKDITNEEFESSTQRWKLAGLVLMGLFFLAFPVFRLYEPTQRADARAAQEGFLADQGADLFDANCSSCHGAAGSGAIAPALGSKNYLDSATDEQIQQQIAVGVLGTEMVPYSSQFGGPLNSQEITAIVTYLRSLEEDAVENPNWHMPLADESLSGRDIYTLACSRCHGLDLGGLEDGGPDIGPGSEAVEDSDARLAKRVREGKKTMPRFDRILTSEQIDLVIAYLREVQQGG